MKINSKDGRYEYVIVGPINEETDIFDQAINDATEVVLDFDKMTFINSLGIRKWQTWAMNTVPGNAPIFMKNCPGFFVSQLHMILSFMARSAHVKSLYAPYVCDECEHETKVLMTEGKEFEYRSSGKPRRIELPADLKCPKCSSTMEPDFVEDRFFRFL